MATDSLLALGACALRDRLASGALSAAELVEACLSRIAAREPGIGAWAFVDAEGARARARALDARFAEAGPVGPLHGLPVGVKDVIDVADLPGENGCALDAGRVPAEDAAAVARLRAAGAIILGKTVTTELAYLRPARTRNPANPAHTPGGSSAGSAAAVAAGMVPLALGTQTGGSVGRPAAFCGVTGFKPSFGAISLGGVLIQSPSLDTLGVFARGPEDAALVADVLAASEGAATAGWRDAFLDRPPVFAFMRLPGWERADAETRAALEALAARLGGQVFEADPPALLAEVPALRALINHAEMARCYARYAREGMDLLGSQTQAALREGAGVRAVDYLGARAAQDAARAALAPVFARADAILCPAAPGPAPLGLGSTGDSVFNGVWTFIGAPAISLPLFRSAGGLPIGAQLAAAPGADGKLLAVARWLAAREGAPA